MKTDPPEIAYRYKVRPIIGWLAWVFILVSLMISREMLGEYTEWHLFSAGDPFVIPNIVLQLVWWGGFGMGVTGAFMAAMPPMQIRLRAGELLVPNMLTRKYMAMKVDEIVEIGMSKYALTLSGKSKRVEVSRMAMRAEDCDKFCVQIADQAGLEINDGRS